MTSTKGAKAATAPPMTLGQLAGATTGLPAAVKKPARHHGKNLGKFLHPKKTR